MIGIGEIITTILIAYIIIKPEDIPTVIRELRHIGNALHNFRYNCKKELGTIMQEIEDTAAESNVITHYAQPLEKWRKEHTQDQ